MEPTLQKFFHTCVALAVAAAAFLGGVTVSHAQVTMDKLPDGSTRGDFVVGPGKQEFELSPGETRTVEITVANRLGTDKTFSIGEEDFTGSEDPNQTVVLLGDDRGPYSLRYFIHTATTTIRIPNGYRARIPVTVSVPADAQPGGLYGSIVVSTVTDRTDTNSDQGAASSAALITRIGVLFFVRVPGPVTMDGHVTTFQITGNKSFIFNEMPISFDILFKNNGNVHVDPAGTISVTNMMGSEVAQISVDPWFAMPQSLRFRQVVWTPPFLMGRYVAHASINPGYGSSTEEANVVFWVIPWKILLAVLAGLIVIIGGLRWIFSKFKISMR